MRPPDSVGSGSILLFEVLYFSGDRILTVHRRDANGEIAFVEEHHIPYVVLGLIHAEKETIQYIQVYVWSEMIFRE